MRTIVFTMNFFCSGNAFATAHSAKYPNISNKYKSNPRDIYPSTVTQFFCVCHLKKKKS